MASKASSTTASQADGAQDAPRKEPGLSERLSKQVALLAAIVGVFVTLNTTITSCTNASVSQAAGYRTALRAEEDFWAKLYDRYLEVIAQPPTDLGQRRARLMAIAMLAGREPARFDEYETWYSLENPVDPMADSNLVRMRSAIHSALADPAVSSPAIASDIGFYLGSQETSAQERESSGGDGGTPPPVTDRARRETIVIEQAQPAATVNNLALGSGTIRPVYGNTIISAGASDGWEVDVFWCVGDQAASQRNYGQAMAVANALAAAPGAGGPGAASALKLGRIRVRSLPLSLQQGQLYTRGDAIVFDGGAGESEAASNAAALVLDKTRILLRQARSTGAATKWYLSLFMCSATARPGQQAG